VEELGWGWGSKKVWGSDSMHQVVGGAALTDGVVFVVGGVSTFVGVISDELHSGSPSNLGVSAPGLSIHYIVYTTLETRLSIGPHQK